MDKDRVSSPKRDGIQEQAQAMVIDRGYIAQVHKMSEADGINKREQTIDEVSA